MTTKNQPATTQTTKQQASARVHTSATVCRAPSCTIGDVLRLLLLLPHKKEGGKEVRRQGGDKRIRTPSHLETLLSPAADAPRKQEIPQGCCDVRLLSSSAASCFRGRGLLHRQGSVPSTIKQEHARWLPMFGYVLGGT
jgi:hypothetical protein